MITSKLDLRSDLTVKDENVNYFSVSSLEKNIKGEEINKRRRRNSKKEGKKNKREKNDQANFLQNAILLRDTQKTQKRIHELSPSKNLPAFAWA